METILKLAKSNHFSISFCLGVTQQINARRDQDQILVVRIIELKLLIEVRSLWMNRLTTSKNSSKFGNVVDLSWFSFSLKLNFPVGSKFYNIGANCLKNSAGFSGAQCVTLAILNIQAHSASSTPK